MIHYLVDEWRIFKKGIDIGPILETIGSPLNAYDKVSYTQAIASVLIIWEGIKEEVKTNNRFFCDISELAAIIKDYQSDIYDKEKPLYRARIHHNKEEAVFSPADMGCPKNPEQTVAGRANPKGIRYLYLCKDTDTPLNEVRPAFFDRIDIGIFKVNSDLRLLDFTQRVDLFKAYEDGHDQFQEEVRRKVLFNALSKDLSAPMHRYDTELEYVPTQYLCEYIKTLGINGIVFESSVHKDGNNVVLFDPNSAECIEVIPYVIEDIVLKSQVI